jgi:hypothetical protein
VQRKKLLGGAAAEFFIEKRGEAWSSDAAGDE